MEYIYFVQKIRLAGRFLAMLFLIGMLWLVYSILSITLVAHPNANLNHIPNNVTTVYRVDGRALSKEFVSSLLLREDDDLETLLLETLPENTEGTLKPVGISFDSDIIVFEFKHKKDTISGWLFNTYNDRIFRKNVPEYLSKNSVLAADNGVGVILSGATVQRSEYWERYAQKIVQTKTSFADTYLNERAGLLSYWQKMKDGTNGFFAVTIDEQDMTISGKVRMNTGIKPHAFNLAPDGFHMETHYVPEAWSLVGQELFGSLEVNVPEIRGFSINYYGVQIVADPDFKALPEANMQVAFAAPVSLDSLFKGKFVDAKDPSNGYRIVQLFGHNYHVKVRGNILEMYIDPTKTKKTATAHLFQISGKPSHLLTVEGDGLIKRLLSLSAVMNATRQLTNSIENVEVHVKKSKGNYFEVSGKIRLGKNEYPANAITKFLLRSELFQ